jgi:hypothetical protein
MFRFQSQGDQIGRIFAHWAIVDPGSCLKITYRSSPNFSLLFSKAKVLTRKCARLHLGPFFHNPIWSPCPKPPTKIFGKDHDTKTSTRSALWSLSSTALSVLLEYYLGMHSTYIFTILTLIIHPWHAPFTSFCPYITMTLSMVFWWRYQRPVFLTRVGTNFAPRREQSQIQH